MEEENRESQEEEEVWSWGAGTDGQLATGRLEDEHTPQLLHSLSSTLGPISFLSCGGAHVIALTPGGRVLTWGRGGSGQLGHGDEVSLLLPMEVEALKGFMITHVSAGWNHSAFVSGNGAIFTCGDGSFGQLGHGDYKSHSSPQQVLHFSSNHVHQVACGMRHSLVLLRGDVENKVFGFGSGKRGQLGISTEKVKSVNLPMITIGFTNVKIESISANGDHSVALSSDGGLYTWGRGFGCNSDAYVPRLLNLEDLSFSQVALGWNHALLLTREGELFMLGGERHGVLSDPVKTSSNNEKSNQGIIRRVIPHLGDTKVLQISAGAEHSAIVLDSGSVMTWGWGEHGQLGLGDTIDHTNPHLVSLGHSLTEKHTIPRVYCGSGFSFVLRKYDWS